jgi:Putative peptidoglycan binding domain
MASFVIFEGAGGGRFVGEPGFGDLVADISRRSGVRVNSHARDEEAEPLLHQIGLHSQAEVIRFHEQGVAGYGPANPVERSTHCRRNDGVAYPGRPGAKLKKYQRGIDTANSPRFCEEARKDGFIATVTYPHSVGEAQHVNFRKQPKFSPLLTWKIRPLKRGMRGQRVNRVTRILVTLGYLTVAYQKRNSFDSTVDRAVRHFQRDHHQKPDGVVGAHTRAQLDVARRHRRSRRK